jgi:hypothetical protein
MASLAWTGYVGDAPVVTVELPVFVNDAATLDEERESGRDLMDAMPDYVSTLE